MHAATCSNCGASVDEDASERCPECNAPLKVVCASCGALVPEDDETCPVCGGSLADASQPG